MGTVIKVSNIHRASRVTLKGNKISSLGYNSYISYQNIKICKDCSYKAIIDIDDKDVITHISYQGVKNLIGSYFNSGNGIICLKILFKKKKTYTINKIIFINMNISLIEMPIVDKIELNDVVDHVYVLNRDVDIVRMKKVDTILKSNNIEYERFSAIDGINLEDINSNFNKYAYGCYLSHISIYKNAIANKYKSVCIFEDDIILSSKFKSDLFNLYKSVPSWQMIYLGCSQQINTWDELTINYNLGYYYSKKCNGTFAYCIKVSLLEKILSYIENKLECIDTILHSIQNNYACYSALPSIVISDVTNSTIRESRDQCDISQQNGWRLDRFSVNS